VAIKTVVPQSSNIRSFSYDDETQVLTVEFWKGGGYEYEGVDVDTFLEFSNAESAGIFFHGNIRGQYASRRTN